MERPKEITEEQELLAQSVRNWNGGKFVYDNIKQRLENLRKLYENLEKEKTFKKSEKK